MGSRGGGEKADRRDGRIGSCLSDGGTSAAGTACAAGTAVSALPSGTDAALAWLACDAPDALKGAAWLACSCTASAEAGWTLAAWADVLGGGWSGCKATSALGLLGRSASSGGWGSPLDGAPLQAAAVDFGRRALQIDDSPVHEATKGCLCQTVGR